MAIPVTDNLAGRVCAPIDKLIEEIAAGAYAHQSIARRTKPTFGSEKMRLNLTQGDIGLRDQT